MSKFGGDQGAWRKEARDKYGRWVESGGMVSFEIEIPGRDGVVAAEGEFISNKVPGYATIRVKPGNSIPAGDYVVPHANMVGIKALLNKDYVAKKLAEAKGQIAPEPAKKPNLELIKNVSDAVRSTESYGVNAKDLQVGDIVKRDDTGVLGEINNVVHNDATGKITVSVTWMDGSSHSIDTYVGKQVRVWNSSAKANERKTGLFNEYSENRLNQDTGENVPLASLGFNPEQEITIYRGVPSEANGINPGDWVTDNPQLAKDYAGQGGKVVSIKVKVKDLLADPSNGEGGYTEEMIYRPSGGNTSKTKVPATPDQLDSLAEYFDRATPEQQKKIQDALGRGDMGSDEAAELLRELIFKPEPRRVDTTPAKFDPVKWLEDAKSEYDANRALMNGNSSAATDFVPGDYMFDGFDGTFSKFVPDDPNNPTGAGHVERVETSNHKLVNNNGRVTALVEINGVQVPFYLSSGSGGKKDVEAGKWYPFFGTADQDGWYNKSNAKYINDYYGSPELRAQAEWLNANIGDVRGDKSIPVVGANQQDSFANAINKDMHPVNNLKDGEAGYEDVDVLMKANVADVIRRVRMEPENSMDLSGHTVYTDFDSSKITEEQEEAINWFIDSGYEEADNYLRKGEPVDDEDRQRINILLDMIDSSTTTDDSIVYRGRPVTTKSRADLLNNLKVGDTLTDPGIVSTSDDYNSAKIFADMMQDADTGVVGRFVFKINLPKGSKAYKIDYPGRFRSHEKETILPPNIPMKVIKIEDIDGIRHIEFDAQSIQKLDYDPEEPSKLVSSRWDGIRFDASEIGDSGATNNAIYEPNPPKTMYHVAPKSAREDITKNGLDAKDETWNTGAGGSSKYHDEYLWDIDENGNEFPYEYRPTGIYMFPTIEQAQEYANGKDVDIYKINTPLNGNRDIIRDPVHAGNWDDLEEDRKTYVTRYVEPGALKLLSSKGIVSEIAESKKKNSSDVKDANGDPIKPGDIVHIPLFNLDGDDVPAEARYTGENMFKYTGLEISKNDLIVEIINNSKIPDGFYMISSNHLNDTSEDNDANELKIEQFIEDNKVFDPEDMTTVSSEDSKLIRSYTNGKNGAGFRQYDELSKRLTMSEIETAAKDPNSPDHEIAKSMLALDAIINRSPILQPGLPVYRGLKVSKEFYDDVLSGKETEFLGSGYSSTSDDREVAEHFSNKGPNNFGIVMIAYPGERIPGLRVPADNSITNESEILLPRGLKFEIVKVTEADYNPLSLKAKKLIVQVKIVKDTK